MSLSQKERVTIHLIGVQFFLNSRHSERSSKNTSALGTLAAHTTLTAHRKQLETDASDCKKSTGSADRPGPSGTTPCSIKLIYLNKHFTHFLLDNSSGSQIFLALILVFFIVCSPCGEQKANVGLNLKFNKKNEEVPGYTKRTEKEWLYSVAVEELLAEYLDRYKRKKILPNFLFIYHRAFHFFIFLFDFYAFIDFLKYSTQCPKTAMMMFSMKMTSGLDWTRMGKTHYQSYLIPCDKLP